MILVTGGAGFIGSHFIVDWFNTSDEPVVNLDKLTYAGSLERLSALSDNKFYQFVLGDILDTVLVKTLFDRYQPRALIHFAAESHVDRAIASPNPFIYTNIVGTFSLLEAAYRYWQPLTPIQQSQFRFLHVSTDEVYGSLKKEALPIKEGYRYLPSNPYAASKAASDHLVWAWFCTYKLPIIVTHAGNNYGASQDGEKLIPATIRRLWQGRPAQLYGDGQQKRDWLHVSDHGEALRVILQQGKVGETYHIGATCEKTNLEVVQTIDQAMQTLQPGYYTKPVQYLPDRWGHDQRYALNTQKLQALGWRPKKAFATEMIKTVQWYLNHFARCCVKV